MKTIKKLFVVAAATIFSSVAFAQTADDIINKYFETIGGKEKFKNLNAVKMDISVQNQGMEIPVELVNEKGGKMYVKINIQGKEITQMASDGNTMWNTNFMTMKAEKLDAETTENAKLSNQDFPDPLLDYKEKGYSTEFVGKETKEGTECFKMKLTKKPVKVAGVQKDDIIYYYFDAENYLPILTESEIKSGPMAGKKSETKYSDYQEVDGLYFPFSMNMFGQDMKVKKITLNPTVDQKVYAFPAQ